MRTPSQTHVLGLAHPPIPRESQVLPGHGEFSTFGAELDNNYYIRSALRGGNDSF